MNTFLGISTELDHGEVDSGRDPLRGGSFISRATESDRPEAKVCLPPSRRRSQRRRRPPCGAEPLGLVCVDRHRSAVLGLILSSGIDIVFANESGDQIALRDAKLR